MRKFVVAVLLLGFIVVGTGVRTSCAGEIDLLLQKLVEKGVLTAGEAQQIGTETKEQIKAEIAAGQYSSLPAWVQNTKLKGDFRLRYQMEHTSGSTSRTYRQRERIRLRLGVESKANEKLLVGIGLATGLNDGSADAARSTNATLENGFSKKIISLDYAYAQYMPNSWMTLIGGKFKNPLWEPGDLIWDTDINPEGGVIQLSRKLNSRVEGFLNAGVLVLDELSTSNHDPMLNVVQSGVKIGLSDTVSLKTALSFYNAAKVKGQKLDGTAGTNRNNGTASGNQLLDGYTTLTPAAEITVKDPLKSLGIELPMLGVFGEYVNNPQAKDNGNGYMVGCKFGAEKVSKWGDWQFAYNFAQLQQNAVLDILPDSDRVGGKTGVRAHEGILQFGLGKNTALNIDYYYGWNMASKHAGAHVAQVDWNVKF
ncbi:MAG: putative porin [Candidatus Omnitrophota bacterium]|jgi:hypothetical protein